MSDTGKQSPLGVNVNNALLTAEGFTINPQFASWVGSSRNFPDYSFGRICQETVLRVLTWAIHQGYYGNPDGRMTKITMDNIITIGNGTTRIPITSIVSGQIPGTDQYYFEVTYNNPNIIITVGQYIRITGAAPDGYNGNWLVSEVVNTSKFRIYTTAFYGVSTAPGVFIVDTQVPGLGNAKPMVYTWEWLNGPYGTGKFNLGDSTGWGGSTYQDRNPAIQWAYIRLLALQAWMEFNYNSTLERGNYENPQGYRDFIQSFQNAAGFISYSNDAILPIDNSKDFLDGTFSNMNDLITADITNVNLALKAWGQDLIALGKALDLSSIDNFGMPSALLKTLAKYNAITKNLGLAIVSAGIPTNALGTILSNLEQPTIEQERKLYATFVLTVGDSLTEILIALNCKTAGLESLADLLDPKKLFPNSYKSLTVPLYRDNNTPITTTTTTSPTNPNITPTVADFNPAVTGTVPVYIWNLATPYATSGTTLPIPTNTGWGINCMFQGTNNISITQSSPTQFVSRLNSDLLPAWEIPRCNNKVGPGQQNYLKFITDVPNQPYKPTANQNYFPLQNNSPGADDYIELSWTQSVLNNPTQLWSANDPTSFPYPNGPTESLSVVIIFRDPNGNQMSVRLYSYSNYPLDAPKVPQNSSSYGGNVNQYATPLLTITPPSLTPNNAPRIPGCWSYLGNFSNGPLRGPNYGDDNFKRYTAWYTTDNFMATGQQSPTEYKVKISRRQLSNMLYCAKSVYPIDGYGSPGVPQGNVAPYQGTTDISKLSIVQVGLIHEVLYNTTPSGFFVKPNSNVTFSPVRVTSTNENFYTGTGAGGGTTSSNETVTFTYYGQPNQKVSQNARTIARLSPSIVSNNGNKYILSKTFFNWEVNRYLANTGGAPWILNGITYPEMAMASSSATTRVLLPPAITKLKIQIRNASSLPNPNFTFVLIDNAGFKQPYVAPSITNLYSGNTMLVDSSDNNGGLVYTLFFNQDVSPSSTVFGYLAINAQYSQTFSDLNDVELYIEADVDFPKYNAWYNNVNWDYLQTFTTTILTTTSGDGGGGGGTGGGGPTVVTTNLSNSKISYLLYTDQGGVNPQLTSSQVVQKVGIQLPPGPPLISEGTIGNQDGVITIQEPARGFGSYLSTIVPPNIATTAGAFGTSMKQIKNIKEIPIEKFAQVVTNLETMAVINANGTQTPLLTNTGTPNNVPTNLNLRAKGRPLVALGSGPQGSYTVSDFFGCMSGLPYNGSSGNSQLGIPESGLEGIYNKLKELATTKLSNIYDELYLAVTWERAKTYISQNVFNELVQPYIRNKDNPDYDPNPDIPNPAYNPALPIGPGNEPTIPNPKYDPYLYLNAASGEGTNEEHFQPRIDNWFYTVNFGINVNGGGYGRGSAPLPNIRLYPNNCKGSIGIRMGRTTADIPNEFGRIFETGKSFGSKYRYATTTVFQPSAPPAPVPPEEFLYIQGPPIEMLPVLENGNKNPNGQNNDPGWLAGSQGGGNPGYNAWPAINAVIQGYINQANQEIDRINSVNRPSCIKLNNYWNSTGYQLTIEQRARMNGLKPPLPDSRENFLSLYPTTMYTFTDSLPNYGKSTEPHMYAQTIENIANWNTIGGVSMVAMMRQDRNQARLAAIGVELDNNIPDKLPYEQQRILISNGTLPTGSNNSNIPSGSTISQPGDPFVPITTPPSTPVVIRDRVPVTPVQPGTINIGTSEYVVVSPVYGGQGPGYVIDTGGPRAPGSFAGSPYSNLIPPNLNSWYSSSTLMPSTYTVNDAIEEVILCNCDCWNLA